MTKIVTIPNDSKDSLTFVDKRGAVGGSPVPSGRAFRIGFVILGVDA